MRSVENVYIFLFIKFIEYNYYIFTSSSPFKTTEVKDVYFSLLIVDFSVHHLPNFPFLVLYLKSKRPLSLSRLPLTFMRPRRTEL